MYIGEISSRSLHKPYIIAESRAMEIMHIYYHTIVVGRRNILEDMVWEFHNSLTSYNMHLIVEADYVTYTPQHNSKCSPWCDDIGLIAPQQISIFNE